ncbi:Glutathione import ATP-binding protein GsiA [Alphaproteobacteria bacterium SO-S41]|nr:Glutathione import ATP-binding protein GsiA [Alphaproteobacteria bacterium SO-S41]
MSVLSFRDVTLDYAAGRAAGVRVLDRVSFEVGRGRTTALVGESGSGKSTLALAAMGLLPRHAKLSGSIVLDDGRGPPVDLGTLDREGKTYRNIRGGRIGLVFQEPLSAFSPVHTVGSQIAEATRAHEHVSRAAARARAVDMLRLTGFHDPERGFDAYPFELSGGLRQRAMIAAALAAGPSVLIADEPTTALDVTIQAQVLALLERLKGELGLSILFITHDLGVVAAIADDLVVLYRGQVMERGAADAVFADSRHPYFQALQGANPSLARKETRLTVIGGEADTAAAARYTQGPVSPRDETAGGPLIDLENVSKSFAARRGGVEAPALDRVSLAIARGESIGLVGESGSGKSTLAKVLMRVVTPDSGRVVFHARGQAHDVATLKGEDLGRYRRRVAYVFQDPYAALNPRMSVRDTLTEPFAIHGTADRHGRDVRARELIDLVGLPRASLDRYPPAFSGGQRQRIAIARALAMRPELLILDEPTSSLDVSVQAQILNLLGDLRRELGFAYLFISHDLAVVEHIAERVAVMRHGRIVEEAPAERLFHDARHPYTRALIAAAPEADRKARLDLGAVMARAAEDWGDDRQVTLVEIEPGHRVAMPVKGHANEAA